MRFKEHIHDPLAFHETVPLDSSNGAGNANRCQSGALRKTRLWDRRNLRAGFEPGNRDVFRRSETASAQTEGLWNNQFGFLPNIMFKQCSLKVLQKTRVWKLRFPSSIEITCRFVKRSSNKVSELDERGQQGKKRQ
jgi:hypothetical protein